MGGLTSTLRGDSFQDADSGGLALVRGHRVLKFIVLQLCEQIDALSTWNVCVCGSNVRRNSAARREVGSSGSLTLPRCEEP